MRDRRSVPSFGRFHLLPPLSTCFHLFTLKKKNHLVPPDSVPATPSQRVCGQNSNEFAKIKANKG
jgi:hypothetical protein